MANSLYNEWGELVKPANFTLASGLPGGIKLGHDYRHIYMTINAGVGGTPMPAFKGVLNDNEIWDVVHYVQSLRVEAHIKELNLSGLLIEKIPIVRARIWRSISQAANHQDDKSLAFSLD